MTKKLKANIRKGTKTPVNAFERDYARKKPLLEARYNTKLQEVYDRNGEAMKAEFTKADSASKNFSAKQDSCDFTTAVATNADGQEIPNEAHYRLMREAKEVNIPIPGQVSDPLKVLSKPNTALPAQIYSLAMGALAGNGTFSIVQGDDYTMLELGVADSVRITYRMPENELVIGANSVVDGHVYKFSGKYSDKSGGMVENIREGLLNLMDTVYNK